VLQFFVSALFFSAHNLSNGKQRWSSGLPHRDEDDDTDTDCNKEKAAGTGKKVFLNIKNLKIYY